MTFNNFVLLKDTAGPMALYENYGTFKLVFNLSSCKYGITHRLFYSLSLLKSWQLLRAIHRLSRSAGTQKCARDFLLKQCSVCHRKHNEKNAAASQD